MSLLMGANGIVAAAAKDVAESLLLHPTLRCDAVRGIEVRVESRARGVLMLSFAVDGDIGSIVVPAAQPSRRTDFLWQHTCFEAFIGIDGAPSYHEINLSPSTAWAIYGFRRYREIESTGEDAAALRIRSTRNTRRLQVTADVDLRRLSASYVDARLRLGMSAVIEEQSGTLSYWALHHPAGAPDFHHAAAFTMRL